MFDSFQQCPYTGLRSFTEEESLYFKGREKDIEQASQQLQKNKFLMLTGASGDGKSSLIYAGIVPNARAGFLKSKYTSWRVADFRPERTPFLNLCKALAKQLNIPEQATVESELRHGFSALVDLYKNSPCYLDPELKAYLQGDEGQRSAIKRQTANLIIIVDQFEEFFTNPENYKHGVPSNDANLVLNLLLETARIALDEDLPIFIVFTMRSDFIGQCAAFRSLPEYIGFSQFFVPRLNRSQLQQVIEEPAWLSGNRITRRLTERLIHDIAEGVDQLPILQHALNQIWHAAEEGRVEMDLIHYAMVGGMSADELPDDQLKQFNQWFDKLAPNIKDCYAEPNLQNVLDTHANKLYESAHTYFKSKTGRDIAETQAKNIIRTVFTCLTKIDQGRAVRNRMTLNEIHHILDTPGLNLEDTWVVLSIYREPGNTFIRPFITDDVSSESIQATDVLDITHESLIRNWDLLKSWAKAEYDSFSVSQDFEQQLGRWVDSNKSRGFLLPIGALTYFEDWFQRAKPNAWWIARYLSEDTGLDKKLADAGDIIQNGKEFLKQSASKHGFTRLIMRVGAKRIAAVLAMVLVIGAAIISLVNVLSHRNPAVLTNMYSTSMLLANKSDLSMEYSVPTLVEQLLLGQISIQKITEDISDLKQKIKINTGIAIFLTLQGRSEPKKDILASLNIADSLLHSLPLNMENPVELSAGLRLISSFRTAILLAHHNNQDKSLKNLLLRSSRLAARWAKEIITKQPKDFQDIQGLNLALEHGLNFQAYDKEEINLLIQQLSPWDGQPSNWVQNNYQRNKLLLRGPIGYSLSHHGLYQELAYLYAALGQNERVMMCLDTLLAFNQTYFENNYDDFYDNATNILAVFVANQHTGVIDEFIDGYSRKKGISALEFLNRAIGRMIIDYGAMDNIMFYAVTGETYSNLNVKFPDETFVQVLFNEHRKIITSNYSGDALHYNLALAFKHEGIFRSFSEDIRGNHKPLFDTLFQAALEHYLKVSESFLAQNISIIGTSSAEILTQPAKYLFLYPDLRFAFHCNEPRSWNYIYLHHAWVQFLLDQGLFNQVYGGQPDLKYFEDWLLNYNGLMCSREYFYRNSIPHIVLKQLATALESLNFNATSDLNLLYFHIGLGAYTQKDTFAAFEAISKVDSRKILNAFRYKGLGFLNSYSLEILALNIANLAANDEFDEITRLISTFKKQENRSTIYAFASQTLSQTSQIHKSAAARLLDSALVEMNRIENPATFQPNRMNVAIALMYLDPIKNKEKAYRTIKNSPVKFNAMVWFGKAEAQRGRLYSALKHMPSAMSSANRGDFLFKIMQGYNLYEGSLLSKPEWKNYYENELFDSRRFLQYINE